jgi:hypothetical protein
MDLLETSIQSFVIKIWVEETIEEAGEVVWRGHIIHTHSGEKQHFKSMDEMVCLMGGYLQEIGIEAEQAVFAPQIQS